jgi:ribonuclease HIII
MAKPTQPSLRHHNWAAWIGTDEAGKGDYFGPLVVAGVYVNPEIRQLFHTLGVRDGKKLSDSRVRKLAQEIQVHCERYISSSDLQPAQYNKRYDLFRKRGQNLNHLLASLHAGVIQDLRKRADCHHILVDRFAKEEVLATQLGVTPNSDIKLVQVPKAESDIAVAAASIIARSVFLQRLEQLSNRYQIQLPKGASQVIDIGKQYVKRHGPESLHYVAKLHFRTTTDILEDDQ